MLRNSSEAEVHDIIIDYLHASDSWTLLKYKFGIKGDLRVNRLKTEFSSVVMTDPSCNEYIKSVEVSVGTSGMCGGSQ